MTSQEPRPVADPRLAAVAVALAVMAWIAWASRDFAAELLADSYLATIQLATTAERDDTRVTRAFAVAQGRLGGPDITLELLPDQRQVRHSVVHVPGPTEGEAIARAQAFSQALVAAFGPPGTGTFDADVRRKAAPVLGAASRTLRTALTFGAALFGLIALAVGLVFWRRWRAGPNRVPPQIAWSVVAGVGVLAALAVLPGWAFAALFAMAIPGSISGMIVYKMQQVHRAASWPSAQARITRSRLRILRHRGDDGATTVDDTVDVEYAYTVGGVDYRCSRIGIGEITPGSTEIGAVLDRYSVGRSAPVFYNPDDPQEAVLERDAPASPLVMYLIAAGVALVGLAVVLAFVGMGDIVDSLSPYFRPDAFIPGFLFFAVAAVMMVLILLAHYRQALVAKRWPIVKGTIVSSTVGSRRIVMSGSTQRSMTVWSPVVEYVYSVDGREHHGARIAFGGKLAGGQSLAEAVTARYPEGGAVTVCYDPRNPSFAVLEPRIALAWPALVLAVAFALAAAFFARWF